LDRLREIGRRLLEAAGGDTALPEVRLWVAQLDANSYSPRSDSGQQIQMQVPEEIARELAPAQAHLSSLSEISRLRNRYALSRAALPYRAALAPLADAGELAADYRIARELQADVADEPVEKVRAALAGLAAAVLNAAVHGTALPDGSLEWAGWLLIDCVLNPSPGPGTAAGSMNLNGADCQAALALPLVLLILDDQAEAEQAPGDTTAAEQAFQSALTANATSPSDEVSVSAAHGLRCLRGRPCEESSDGRCWHELVWQAVEEGARRVVLGPVTARGFREPEIVLGDLIEGLRDRPDEDLLLSSIGPAAIAALELAEDDSCIADRATLLRAALLDAYARAARHWAINNYDWRDEPHAAFASALLHWAVTAGHTVIVELAEQVRAVPDALASFLRALTVATTHETEFVPVLTAAWATLMELGLRALRDETARTRRGHSDTLILNLIPDPTTFPYIGDVESILAPTRGRWLVMEAIGPHMGDWLNVALNVQLCVDTLVGFLRTQPIERQVSPGLSWVRRLVVAEDGSARTSGFLLVSWLGALHDTHALRSDSRADYRAVVDALTLSRYRGARDLQQRDE
jgi:hypothetical protein